jgi:hypothetical protein
MTNAIEQTMGVAVGLVLTALVALAMMHVTVQPLRVAVATLQAVAQR